MENNNINILLKALYWLELQTFTAPTKGASEDAKPEKNHNRRIYILYIR